VRFLLLLVLLVPAVARAEVKSIETGGFGLDRNVTVAGTPVQVYDMITGDLRPWWDHTFSAHPQAFYIEPWPGGGFIERFDDHLDASRPHGAP